MKDAKLSFMLPNIEEHEFVANTIGRRRFVPSLLKVSVLTLIFVTSYGSESSDLQISRVTPAGIAHSGIIKLPRLSDFYLT